MVLINPSYMHELDEHVNFLLLKNSFFYTSNGNDFKSHVIEILRHWVIRLGPFTFVFTQFTLGILTTSWLLVYCITHAYLLLDSYTLLLIHDFTLTSILTLHVGSWFTLKNKTKDNLTRLSSITYFIMNYDLEIWETRPN